MQTLFSSGKTVSTWSYEAGEDSFLLCIIDKVRPEKFEKKLMKSTRNDQHKDFVGPTGISETMGIEYWTG